MKKNHFTPQIGSILSLVILIGGAALILAPLAWTVSMALKSDAEIYMSNFFPKNISVENFGRAVRAVPFWNYVRNTALYVLFNLIGVVGSCSITAYGFSRFTFKGKRTWFLILLATMMLPGQITMIPRFLMFREIHWIDSYLPLVVPGYFATSAFDVFLLRQFISGIPKDFDEAATIDGANTFKIFIKIILPMIRPALMAVTIFTFMGTWNDFNGPLVYIYNSANYTISLGLSFFKGLYTSQWNLLMAATLLSIAPVLVLFVVCQKQIIDGIAISSGTKG
jgi:multiple sugar transport system permease protein